MIVQCCVCRRFRRGNDWLPLPLSFESDEVTHTYCPGCAEKAFAKVAAYAPPAMASTDVEKLLP